MAVISMKRKQEELIVKVGFEEFLRQAKARNLASATISSYEAIFNRFYTFYEGDIAFINNDTIMSFIEYLQKTGIKLVSINTYLRHMKAIFRFWESKGYMQEVKIRFLKIQEEVKDVFSDQDLSILLKKPDTKKCTFQEIRTWSVINFLTGTGCRVGALTEIKIGDVDFSNGLIQYGNTKNKKAQYVPLSHQLTVVLMEYLNHRSGTENDYLFPSEDNTKLLESSVTHNIKYYNKRRGVKEGNCHLFRHTFAKNWILSGGDPLRLQKILGHSSLAMVQHYANIFKADLKVGYEEFNLLSKFSRPKIKM
ncbi:MAG: tyrosine-type recombinase/integrase [Clostridiaceae bacterium]|nr:tyrosine-type recombinase/integrase [Clostridiaceae bacterium]